MEVEVGYNGVFFVKSYHEKLLVREEVATRGRY